MEANANGTAAYATFLAEKRQLGGRHGFAPLWMPDFLYPFQAQLVEWAILRGRSALMEDCGLGKTPQQLVWAENVVRHTNRPVLVLTPPAVAPQTVAEGEKFGIECVHSRGGKFPAGARIVVTNYEQLHHFNANDFSGCVADECFAPETLIDTIGPDGRERREYIKDVRIGAKILNAFGVDTVADVHRREVEFLVRTQVNGRSITSSPNHPYYTQRGWVGALDLLPGDYVLETAAAVRLVQDDILSEVPGFETPDFLRDILLSEMADVPTGEYRQGPLCGSGGPAREEAERMVRGGEPESRGGTQTLCRPELVGDTWSEGEALPYIAREGANFRTWWKRKGAHRSAGTPSGVANPEAYSGVHLQMVSARAWLSHPLQTRLSLAREEARHRGGWTLAPEQEEAGREEGHAAGFVRVDGIEVLELGHPDLERLRDADGKLYLYDLGATRHPSYSVEGLLVHNSGILKNFDGVRKAAVIEFLRTLPYRILCTATAAPNDYVELGNHSEALGELGYMDMLGRFFKSTNGSLHPYRTGHLRAITGEQWRFRGHAERDFWRWVCSWARAVRKPSDLGFPDGDFLLPPLETREHVVEAKIVKAGSLFESLALTRQEQLEVRRRTLPERCEKMAELLSAHDKPAVAWCQLNPEGDLLAKLIPGAVQVSGADSEECKEEVFGAFARGEVTKLVTKARIGGWGLNWQHCAHMATFASDSFESYYQSVRRFWRFGQQNPVTVELICSEGEGRVLANLQRKAATADVLFASLVSLMNDSLAIERSNGFHGKIEVPAWL